MEIFSIPTEQDFKRWITEAVRECLKVQLQVGGSPTSDDEALLTRKETAKKLRISLVTLSSWVKKGLPSHKNGGKVYFVASEVMEYVRRNHMGEFGFAARFREKRE